MNETMDPVLARLLADQSPSSSLDIATMRGAALDSKRRWNDAPRPWLISASDPALSSRTGRPVQWYQAGPDRRLAPVLWLHGGGWAIGSLATHHGILADMAHASGRRVYALQPRQAPEAPYPAPLDDCVAGLSALGQRYPAGFHLAGDSAGANLALGALARYQAQGCTVALRSLTLFYGCYDASLSTDSHARLGDGRWGFSTARMRVFWQAYGGAGEPDADLLHAPLPSCPPVAIHAADLDPLRDESWVLARRLNAPVTLWSGLPHGFLHYAPDLPQGMLALQQATDFMNRNDP